MQTINSLREQIAALRAEYQEKAETATVPELRAIDVEVRALGAKLVDAVTVGANPCPSCGGAPHGMPQDFTVGKQVFHGFEIGCTRDECRDHHALGFTRDNAVERWNAGPTEDGWIPPKHGVRLVVGAEGKIERHVPVEQHESAEGKDLVAAGCKPNEQGFIVVPCGPAQ